MILMEISYENGGSLTEARKILKISPTSIGQAALFKTSAKSFWSFYKFTCLDIKEYKKYSPKQFVYIYNEFGVYEKCFNSMSECAKYLNDSVSHIQHSIKTGIKTKGYHWIQLLSMLNQNPKDYRE